MPWIGLLTWMAAAAGLSIGGVWLHYLIDRLEKRDYWTHFND